MSLPYFPPNKSKQQESEHTQKQMSKILNEQKHSDNAIENMSVEDYARFIEDNDNKRQARVEVEREKWMRATALLYVSILFGVVSILIGLTIGYGSSSLFGWLAIIVGVFGIALLAKASIGSYGIGFGWRGVLSFFLALWGIILGFGALTGFSATLVQ